MKTDSPFLTTLVADHRSEILEAWKRAQRGAPLLATEIGRMLDAIGTGVTSLPLPPQLDGSFDLAQLILEIEALRDSIKRVPLGDGDVVVPLREMSILDRVFDTTISELVHRSTKRRSLPGDRPAVSDTQLAVRPANAALLVAEVISAHARAAGAKGIRLRGVDELLGAELWCDRDRIAQVFASILTNAIHACGAGDEIVVRGIVGETEARFAISDPGPGMDPDELRRVFDQATGLALHVSKGIIDAHDGEMWVESSVGDGTTFFFTLPLAP